MTDKATIRASFEHTWTMLAFCAHEQFFSKQIAWQLWYVAWRACEQQKDSAGVTADRSRSES